MKTYTQEFIEAVERTKKYGLSVPTYEINESKRWFNDKKDPEFPSIIQNFMGTLSVLDIAAQCFSVNYELAPV